jgi:AcrR family transcriptional regulator
MSSLKEANEQPQTYSSPGILERRRRILHETRNVIAEQGVAALSMNEIGRRADVAKRTLYNAFQTRERMIGTAIQEYFDEYVNRITFTHPPGTMMRNLERMISVVQRNRKIRNYIRAIMAIYFSSEVDPDIWQALHAPGARNNREWIEALQGRKQLQPWIRIDNFVDDLVRFEYATINEWAQERIADDEITVRLISGYLTLMLGATRGAARKEVEALLNDLAARGVDALPMHKRAT